jgi:hypothetical protein
VIIISFQSKRKDIYKENMKNAMKVVIDLQFLPVMTDSEKVSEIFLIALDVPSKVNLTLPLD